MKAAQPICSPGGDEAHGPQDGGCLCLRYASMAENDLREAGAKLAAALGAPPQSGSLSDNPGDNPVTAWKR